MGRGEDLTETRPLATVLVVDDEEFFRRLLERFLTDAGYRVQVAESGWQALSLIALDPPHLVLLDYALVGETGMDILKRVKEKVPRLPVVMVTGQDGAEVAATLMKAGATDYVAKPFDRTRLLAAVKEALERR